MKIIADIGGTNARFALVNEGRMYAEKNYLCEKYPSLADAAKAYLKANDAKPTAGDFSIAGPVQGDVIKMTNHPWVISVEETRVELGLDRLSAYNDFWAVARGVLELKDGDTYKVGGGEAVKGHAIGVLGAGTGLGVAAIAFAQDGAPIIMPGEGGHVTLPTETEREFNVMSKIREQFGHVSAERVISGDGLVNLYNAIREIDGVDLPDRTSAQIDQAAIKGECATSKEALDLMTHFMGSVAGNLALSLGARGGIYVAGGIVPKLGDYFPKSGFREAFEAKGRFREFNQKIPTRVVTHPNVGLLGMQYAA